MTGRGWRGRRVVARRRRRVEPVVPSDSVFFARALVVVFGLVAADLPPSDFAVRPLPVFAAVGAAFSSAGSFGSAFLRRRERLLAGLASPSGEASAWGSSAASGSPAAGLSADAGTAAFFREAARPERPRERGLGSITVPSLWDSDSATGASISSSSAPAPAPSTAVARFPPPPPPPPPRPPVSGLLSPG